MAPVDGREATLGPPVNHTPRPAPQMPAGRGAGSACYPSSELALADFARHLSLSARQRTVGAYLDTCSG
jgi:hypothetical protein